MDPLAGLAQRLALLLVDLGETLSGHFPGLGVSHTKHIVGLNSPIHTTVAGNGLAEGLDGLVGLWWGYLEECRARLVLRLRLDNLLTGSNQSLSVVFLCVQIGFFLCQGVGRGLPSVEGVFLGGEDGLNDFKKVC